jgi:tetratricopeptide (TPR) repeat protein
VTALRINPQQIETLVWYSWLKLAFCRFEASYELVQKALQVDPVNLPVLVQLHRYRAAVFQFRRSLQALDRIEELYPGREVITAYRAWVYMLMGRYATALDHYHTLTDTGLLSMVSGFRVYAYQRCGKTQQAHQLLTEMKQSYRSTKGSATAYNIALGSWGIGAESDALDWLEQAYEDRDGYLQQLAHRILWGELHWNTRFQAVLQKIGVPMQLAYIRRALDTINQV